MISVIEKRYIIGRFEEDIYQSRLYADKYDTLVRQTPLSDKQAKELSSAAQVLRTRSHDIRRAIDSFPFLELDELIKFLRLLNHSDRVDH